MRIRLFCYAFSASAAAALLAACAGAQLAIGVPNAGGDAIENTSTTSYQLLYRVDKESGVFPEGGLLDVGADLYGIAAAGGNSDCNGHLGCGTIYRIGTNGVEKSLFTFTNSNGANPSSALIDVKGALYGTTSSGGATGKGTFYSITPSGAEKVLYSFGGTPDGQGPSRNLIAVDGTLYGVTAGGGMECSLGPSGCGTVYTITTGGVERVLYRFKGGSDGAAPSGLALYNGMLYGTTSLGGDVKGACSGFAANDGCGTFYALTASGRHVVLYRFHGNSDGKAPQGALAVVSGSLYGTTYSGGSGDGTVYNMTTTGAERVVYSFGGGSDGNGPTGLLDVSGVLYGTTYYGGGTSSACAYACGTIYSVTTDGAERVLYRFAGATDGFYPDGYLTEVKATLYGTTTQGGTDTWLRDHVGRCCGTVFSVTLPGRANSRAHR
jgi:uncharacterized repeat protein (TIGR03803 family)